MRALPLLGDLTQDPSISEWWVSRPVAVPYLSGHRFPFTVMVESADDVYPADVTEAVERFLSLRPEDRESATGRVFKNYSDFAETVSEVAIRIGAVDVRV